MSDHYAAIVSLAVNDKQNRDVILVRPDSREKTKFVTTG